MNYFSLWVVIAIFLNTAVAHGATALTAPQQKEMVKAHNRWRQKVGVPPMRWAADLGGIAQQWAEHLRDANGCNMVHSNTRQLGENLHWASAVQWSDGRIQRQRVTPTQVTDSWGAEKANYNYATNRCAKGKMCGHYTQMVWKSTTELGCGMAFCSDDSQVWACNYRPAGNYVGRKPY